MHKHVTFYACKVQLTEKGSWRDCAQEESGERVDYEPSEPCLF